MSISGISGYDYDQMAINGVQGVGQTDAATPATPATFAPQPTQDQASFSQAGQLMSQLQQLQTTDPAKFKAVTQKISDDLAAQAQSGGNPMLTKLSQKFAQASQSGSMDSLQPRHGKHAGGSKTHGSGKKHGGYKAGGLLDEVNTVIANDLASLSNAGIGAGSSAGLNAATGAATATTAQA